MPFLVSDEKGTVIVDAHAIWSAKTRSDDARGESVTTYLEQCSVLRNYGGQRVPAALGVIEVSLRVSLQPHRKLVKVLGHLVVAIKSLIEVDLSVAVQVA